MVCSRYPKEFRHYETILKRKCFRKLKYNVWERKTKWILLEKADYHYRVKLLHRHINLWVVYLNECYKKKINRRVADALYEDKLKLRGILGLRRNVEQKRALLRICRKKFECNLKYQCWHQWKHYVEKRLKIREVKLLANRIREEGLRIRFFYLWLFRWNEKRSLENAHEAAAEKHETRLKEKYFNAWKNLTNKRIFKMKIEKLAVACYEDKLCERLLRCWKRYTFKKKRYRCQMKIIQDFYQNHLLKNYLSQWVTVYKGLKLERKICNLNLAASFYQRKLLQRSFRIMLKVREARKKKIEKMEKFQEIHIKIYLNLLMERITQKTVWNSLEDKAIKWREDFVLESYVVKLFDRYQQRVEEREEMANVVKYYNAIIIHRAFRGWREVTERKVSSKIRLENAFQIHTERLMKKAFEKWKEFVERKSRKKMADGYYRFILLSRVIDRWKIYHTNRKMKLAEARNLEVKHNTRLMRNTFDVWKNEVEISKSKMKTAVAFCSKSKLSKAFYSWEKATQIKTAYKNRYNRNKTILSSIIIKNSIFLWYEMLSIKRNLENKVQEFRLKQKKRCLRSHYSIWKRFVTKMKGLRQNVEVFPQLRSQVMLDQYFDSLVEAVRSKKVLNGKLELAVEAEEKLLKRRYLRKWVSFICWKNERILRCVPGNRKFSEEASEVFIPVANSTRRKPMIPGYLKADISYVQFEGHRHKRKVRGRGDYHMSEI